MRLTDLGFLSGRTWRSLILVSLLAGCRTEAPDQGHTAKGTGGLAGGLSGKMGSPSCRPTMASG